MKVLRIVITFVTLLFLFGCHQEEPEYPATFNTVETMLSRDPQLSIRLLEELEDSAAGYSEAVRMKYELLKIRAHDKNYEPLASDSVIRIIKDYYDRRGTSNDRMTAYYYMGAYYRDCNDNSRALEWYHKAFEAADTTQQGFSYDIYNAIIMQISYICSDSDNHEEEAEWLRKIDLNRCPNKYAVWNDLGCIYETLNRDSCICFYDLIFEHLQKDTKTLEEHRFPINQQIAFFISENDTARLQLRKDYFLSNKRKDPTGVADLTFGIYYQYVNLPDSSLYYLRRATGGSRLTTVQDAYKRLYHEYRKLGRMDSAQYYCDKYMENTDSLEKQKEEERILKMNRQYNYQRELKEKAELRERSFNNRFWLTACLLFLPVVALVFLIKRRVYRNRIQDITHEQEKSQRDLHELRAQREKELAELRGELEQEQQKRLEELCEQHARQEEELSALHGELEQTQEQYRNVSDRLRQMKVQQKEDEQSCRKNLENLYRKVQDKKKLTTAELATLEPLAEHLCPGFGMILASVLPPLFPQERHLCELAVAGIKGAAAAVLLGGERQYFHQMSSRLCRRLSGGKEKKDLRRVLLELVGQPSEGGETAAQAGVETS